LVFSTNIEREAGRRATCKKPRNRQVNLQPSKHDQQNAPLISRRLTDPVAKPFGLPSTEEVVSSHIPIFRGSLTGSSVSPIPICHGTARRPSIHTQPRPQHQGLLLAPSPPQLNVFHSFELPSGGLGTETDTAGNFVKRLRTPSTLRR